jgi:hypothetical protein
MSIAKLRTKYTEVTGNKAFNGWDEEKLEDLINKAVKPAIDEEEAKRVEEAKEINSKSFVTIPLSKIPPVFKDGKPYAIIDNKYVPWKDAQIAITEMEIEKLQKKVEDIKSGKITF